MTTDCNYSSFVGNAEKVVLESFRCCMAGYDQFDCSCWETNLHALLSQLGPRHARTLMPELHYWTLDLRQAAGRNLVYHPHHCPHLCHDEFMMLAGLAAAQHFEEDCGKLALQQLRADSGFGGADVGQSWNVTTKCGLALFAAGINLQPLPTPMVENVIARVGRPRGLLLN